MHAIGKQMSWRRSKAPERDLTLLCDVVRCVWNNAATEEINSFMDMHTNVCWCWYCVSSSFLLVELFYTIARAYMLEIYYCRILTLLLLLPLMMVISTEKDYRTITATEKRKNDRDGLKKRTEEEHILCTENKKKQTSHPKKAALTACNTGTHQSCSKLLLGINNQKFVQRDTVRILFVNHYKHIASIYLFIHPSHR